MLQQAYEKLVFLEIIPDDLGDKINAQLIGSYNAEQATIHEKYI